MVGRGRDGVKSAGSCHPARVRADVSLKLRTLSLISARGRSLATPSPYGHATSVQFRPCRRPLPRHAAGGARPRPAHPDRAFGRGHRELRGVGAERLRPDDAAFRARLTVIAASADYSFALVGSEGSVTREPEAAPEALALSVGLNPARGPATVRFRVPEADPVRVAVYDRLGREGAVLVDGSLAGGRHVMAFDGAGLPSGGVPRPADGWRDRSDAPAHAAPVREAAK